MTERLYYTDSTLITFTARVVETLSDGGRPALVLDRTAFYPTSGGQPFDTGRLDGRAVVEVWVREADGAVVHILDGEKAADCPAGSTVEGVIDWARRFDHMQQHTGQHILTRAFIETAEAPTASFHLGEDAATIDVDRANLTPALVEAAETLANRVVTDNVPVRVWFPADEELAGLDLRKQPEVDGRLRVVAIGDFDATACGGTHVTASGAVGPIKVTRTEHYKGLTRIEFRCGGRALADYRQKHAIISRLAAELSTGLWELPDSLARLQADNKQLRADLRAARQSLLVLEAGELWAATPAQDGLRVVVRAFAAAARDPAELRPLASRLAEQPRTVALLGTAGDKTQIVMARSADLPDLDMVPLLRGATGALAGGGTGPGGGRPEFAQGGGGPAALPALETALQAAATAIQARHPGDRT